MPNSVKPHSARSSGVTYQQLLDTDAYPVPDVLRLESPVQAMPHMPQSELFVSRLTHAPTQLVSVASQVAAHRPFVHT